MKRYNSFSGVFGLALCCLGFLVFVGCAAKGPARRPAVKEVTNLSREYLIHKDEADALARGVDADNDSVFLNRSSGKIYYVGLLIPMTGRLASMGQQILESVMLAVYSSQYDQIRVVPLDTMGTEDGARIAAQEAVEMKLDAVVGPVFSSETKAARNILQVAGIKAFSLSNDASAASEGVYVFGVPPEALMSAALNFSKQINKHNYGIILPSSEYGYKMGKKIDALLKSLEMFSMSTEYYPRNRELFGAVVNRVSFSSKRSYKVAEDGSLFTENRRDRSKREEAEEELPIVHKELDTLYIDAKGPDLDAIMAEVEKTGVNGGGIAVFIGDVTSNWSERFSYRMEGVMFPSVASVHMNSVETKFETQTGRKPTRISLLAYDAISTIIYVLKKDKSIGKRLHNPDGYNGILGDFRFTPNGLVQRRFGIYIVKNGYPELVYTLPSFV